MFLKSRSTARVATICVIVACLLKSIDGFWLGQELQCHFHDSINITDGEPFPNKSIIHNGIEFPKGHYAMVNHILNGSRKVRVNPHTRGCPCLKKPCVRLCCPFGSYVSSMEFKKDVVCSENEAAKNVQVRITDDKSNQSSIIDLNQHFGHVNRICNAHYMLDDYTINKVNDFDGKETIVYGRKLNITFFGTKFINTISRP